MRERNSIINGTGARPASGGTGRDRQRRAFRLFWAGVLLVAAFLENATAKSDVGAVSKDNNSQQLLAQEEALSFTDVLGKTVTPWEDLTSVKHYPRGGEQRTVLSGEDCDSAGDFPSAGAKPGSVYKLQLHLRHMNFLDDCARARQPDVVFLGDSIVSSMGGAAWREMCNFTGGCANFGVPGQTAEELQYSIQQFTRSCIAPKAFVVNLGADSLLKGVPVRDIVPELKRVIVTLRNHFCHSEVIVTGLLPLVERANYETYEYKNVDGGGQLHFSKIRTISGLLSNFATGQDGVQFIDCHDLFLDRLRPSNIDRLLLEDGIHMSQPGQQLFARCIRGALQDASSLPKTKYGRSTEVEARRDIMGALLREVMGVSYEWRYSSWGPCSSCDGGGTQLRTRACVRQDTGDAVDEALCDEADDSRGGAKAALSRRCVTGCPTYHWVPESWGECSAPCGGGIQSRRVACLSWFGTQVEEERCVTTVGPRSGYPTVQSCNTHSCSMRTACASSSECPANSQCEILRCNGESPGCSRWSTTAETLAANLHADSVRAELDAYLSARPSSNTDIISGTLDHRRMTPEISKLYRSNLRHASMDLTDGECESESGDVECRSSPTARLPWYVRYHAYTAVRGWDTRRCYEYCRLLGKCVATDTDGVCVSWDCGSYASCNTTRPASDFHSPSLTECLYTGGCQVGGGCSCLPGFNGPDCALRVATCPKGATPSNGGCCQDAVAVDGECCPAPGELDAEGRCCVSGRVDACGICDGRGKALDALGECCVGQLDAAGRCCAGVDDAVDECGVCNGDSSSCGFRASGTLRTRSGGISISDVDSELRRNVAQAMSNAAGINNGSSFAVDFIAIQGIDIETEHSGKLLTAKVDFVVVIASESTTAPPMIDGSDVAISATQSSTTQPTLLLAEFEAVLRHYSENTGISNLTDFRRSGVCGNGLCEVGESIFAGALIANACPEDCPFDDSPQQCQQCGANGLCIQATGACLCRTGYTGTNCDQCDFGFTEHTAGQCVPNALHNSAVVAVVEATSSRPESPGSNSGGVYAEGRAISDPLVVCLITVTCILFIALLCLVAYHVHWMRSNTNPPPDLRQENPLNSDALMNHSSRNHSARDQPKLSRTGV